MFSFYLYRIISVAFKQTITKTNKKNSRKLKAFSFLLIFQSVFKKVQTNKKSKHMIKDQVISHDSK